MGFIETAFYNSSEIRDVKKQIIIFEQESRLTEIIKIAQLEIRARILHSLVFDQDRDHETEVFGLIRAIYITCKL